MKASLITTVRNEEKSIGFFLDSVYMQSKKPDEMIIVDGESRDKTAEIIRSYKKMEIKLIVAKSNIARGRNLAIQEARGDIIVVTDAGCRLEEGWFEKITRFDGETDVIAGNYRPLIRTVFDACQYSIMRLFKKENDIVISSRSIAFRKKVWEEIGGYPEWLNYSEDMYFHEEIGKRGYKIKYVKDAVVEWEQRKTLKQVFKQFFLYMEGDGMAKMHTQRHLLRFAAYLGGILLFAESLRNNIFIFPLLAGFAGYVVTPYRNFFRLKKDSLLGRALIIIPFLLIFVDIAKMAGYLSGLLKGKDYFLKRKE